MTPPMPSNRAPTKAQRAVRFRGPEFALWADLPMPDNCDAILVCVDRQRHEPLEVLLPCQPYKKKIEEIFRTYPDAMSITVMPYRNADKIEIKRAALTESKG